MKYLIVGLGNTGDPYTYTRHNIGFRIVDYLAQQQQVSFELDRLAYITQTKHCGRHLHLVKPTTYMNLSGQAVRYWLQKLDIPPNHLLIITDDIHLPLGHLRLRPRGHSGGHNGLANIEQILSTTQFPRLRCGIGNHFLPGQQADYVLANFNTQEQPIVEKIIKLATQTAKDFTSLPIHLVMNQYNKRTIASP